MLFPREVLGMKNVRRIVSFVFAICFLHMFVFSSDVQAQESVDIQAEAAILIDADSGKILYEQNADEKLAIASMTKMMTEYLVLEAIKNKEIEWDQEVPISDYAQQVSQNYSLSNVPLLGDVKYTVKELYESMAIYSANGATIALAELVGGSEANFVKMMNEKANELGLDDVTFVNTTGLNNKDLIGQHPVGDETEENMMSARSTALLAYRLLHDHPNVLETASIPIKNFTKGLDKPIQMLNWNWMLDGLDLAYSGVDGLKTGSTDLAGFAFTGTVKKGDMRFISVVMKTNSAISRFRETAKLYDWGFSQFSKHEIVPEGYQFENKTVPVVKGKQKEVSIEAKSSFSMIVRNNEKDLYKPEYSLDEKKFDDDDELIAPLEKGEKIGTVMVKYSGEGSDYGFITDKVATSELVTAEEVKKANWFTLSMRAIGNFFGGLWDKITG